MPKAEATIKFHLTQIMNNTRSTTTNKKIEDHHDNTDPIQEQRNGETELFMDTVEKYH